MKLVTHWIAFAIPGLLLAGQSLMGAERLDDWLEKEHRQQTGTAITIIFDDSGSMRGEKIAQAKAAFQWWLSTAPEDHRLSLITFAQGGTVQIPLKEGTRNEVRKKVESLYAEYSTPICNSLNLARRQIQERRAKVTPYERHVVLIFTDGAESQDSRGVKGVREEIAKLRRDFIEVVGIGFHGQGDYMQGHATRFFAANNEAELRKGLAKVDAELGDIKDIRVSDNELRELAQMTLTPPASRPPIAASPAANAKPQLSGGKVSNLLDTAGWWLGVLIAIVGASALVFLVLIAVVIMFRRFTRS
ncbi:MAG: VWA domain-containing protein [Verrucomicrobia bacterium]|nr:VWA domain-containing protein [Verrucomicrobiota bacterium]